jgi:hypothetical protein
LAAEGWPVTIFFMTLLCGWSVSIAQASAKTVSPQQSQQMIQQLRNSQMIQAQMELSKVQNELNQKIQEKTELKNQLEQLKSPQAMAKTLKLNSKVKKFENAEAEMRNQLQQLEIDIKDLKEKQVSLAKNIKN